MKTAIRISSLQVAFAALALCFAGLANAASITYYLNQSNTESIWPDGNDYLSVTIFDSFSNPGDIEFLVTPLAPLTISAGPNFGVQSFCFNSTQSLTAANIVGAPVGWTTGSGNCDGFGAYEVTENGDGTNRQNPLNFRITGILGDVLSDYVVDGPGGVQGTYAFAAHVAGMTDQDDGFGNIYNSAWFGGDSSGGTPVVPVPAAVWLLGSAFGLLGAMRRKITA